MRNAMIAIMLIAASGLSCGPKQSPSQSYNSRVMELEEAIDVHVKDSERAKALKGVLAEMRGEAMRLASASEGEDPRLSEAYRDYDATPAEFRRLWQERANVTHGHRARISELRAQAIKLTSETEWKKLEKARASTFEAYVRLCEERTQDVRAGGDL